MIEPYLPTQTYGCGFRGEALESIPELARWISKCERLGLSVKIHCAGDRAVKDTLDAIDVVRSFHGPGRRHQIAHASFIDPADIPHFKDLDVVADLSPIIWYPSPITEAIKAVIPEERAARFGLIVISTKLGCCLLRDGTGRWYLIQIHGSVSKAW